MQKVTKMREGELLNVRYNEDGQRIGEGGKDFASYSGLLAESRISIVDYENWHAVGDEVRDLLWDTIKAKFNLTEDEKKGVVSDIVEKWKEFKSRLTRARWGMDGRKFASSLTALSSCSFESECECESVISLSSGIDYSPFLF
ncbi:hypothetical protein IFM89_032361 [Coptis chinensis]|uniref:Uncharacterized protein n=1 Tax=Coptis chinensis TaxID=261450 RepID=A0A835HXT2_9MAGN|nr:hypothetical protein IFM89_032361 [Coptis chinensis]